MISVVCVFNDAGVLDRRLLSSLRRQTVAPEVIAVDNRDSRYPGAAAALNEGARRATGDWLVFVHQDVELIEDDWLAKAEQLLDQYGPNGWLGVAGLTSSGVFRSFLLDRGRLLGSPFDGLVEVQTLDEVLLIRRRIPAPGSYFDPDLTGWHAYGVEACCRALREGHKNYVLSLAVWHDSTLKARSGFEKSHALVWNKHGAMFHRIYTTCGVLPETYGWNNRLPPNRAQGRILLKALGRVGFTPSQRPFLGEVLEPLTENQTSIDVLHDRSATRAINAPGFVEHPARRRQVIHRFCGPYPDTVDSEALVVMPDVARDLLSETRALTALRQRARRLWLCFRWSDVRFDVAFWRLIRRDSVARVFNVNPDPLITWDVMAASACIVEIDGSRIR